MAKKKKTNKKPEDPIERELSDIKRILVAMMYKLGASLNEVAEVLQMDPGDASRMLPARKIKSIIDKPK